MDALNRDFEGLRVPFEEMGVRWGSVEPFFATFAAHLTQSLLVSVDSRAGSIGLRVRGTGQPYIYQVARFMEAAGIPESGIQRLFARAKYFDAQNASLNVDIDHRGVRECSTMFSSTIEIEVAHAFLADSGVDAQGVGLMEAVAELLNQQSVHSVATCAATSGHLTERVWFELTELETDWERLRSAGLLCGLSDSDWSALDAHRSSLARCRKYASMAFREGVATEGLKVCFEGVCPEILDSFFWTHEDRDRADSIRGVLGRSAYDRVDFRLIPGSPIGLTTHNAG